MRTSVRGTATIVAVLLALLAGAFGCAGPSGDAKPATEAGTAVFPVTVTDDSGRAVTVKTRPERIVSLAPANTETLFALGLGGKVVGVTTYDDFPAEVASIAKIGDFANPNVEAIAAAKPDLILATTGVQAEMIGKLEALGATVVAIDPQTVEGVFADIERVGDLTGTRQAADALVTGMRSDLSAISAAVSAEPSVTAFIEIGQNPLFTAGRGTLLDELIALAGGRNVVTQPGYVGYSAEQLIAADPQVYLATKGSSSDPASVEKRPGYAKLSAVKARRIVILEDSLVSRPGPRIVDGIEQIALGLHPKAFGK